MIKEHKILITGTVGAGKTTAIATVSEVPPICTDVLNTDLSVDKERTTVGFDYGTVTISETERLRIYGTPGQHRFSFMWRILSVSALGVIILVDNTRPDPFSDLSIYLESFKALIKERSCVICITKANPDDSILDNFSSFAASQGVICPIVMADVRLKKDVLMLLDLLLTQLYV